jgi:hypothetical protein
MAGKRHPSARGKLPVIVVGLLLVGLASPSTALAASGSNSFSGTYGNCAWSGENRWDNVGTYAYVTGYTDSSYNSDCAAPFGRVKLTIKVIKNGVALYRYAEHPYNANYWWGPGAPFTFAYTKHQIKGAQSGRDDWDKTVYLY